MTFWSLQVPYKREENPLPGTFWSLWENLLLIREIPNRKITPNFTKCLWNENCWYVRGGLHTNWCSDRNRVQGAQKPTVPHSYVTVGYEITGKMAGRNNWENVNMQMWGVCVACVLKYLNSLALGNTIREESGRGSGPTHITSAHKGKGIKGVPWKLCKIEVPPLRKGIE